MSPRAKSARRRRRRYLPLILVGVTVPLLGAGAFALVRSFLASSPGQPMKVVQEIHVIRPPPPPPDVPPPPPPPDEKVDVPDPQQPPDPAPSNDPPPSERLGLDAEGGAGGDSFGLVGNKGGRELLASGGSAYAWYSNLLQNEIKDCLADNKDVHGSAVAVRMWLRDDGTTIDRVRLVDSTGDHARDKAIETSMQRCRFSRAPPDGTPQPISFRIVPHT